MKYEAHQKFVLSAVAQSALRLSRRPQGMRTCELSDTFGSAAASPTLQKLVELGYLHPLRLGNRVYHYFSTEKAANEYAAKLTPPKEPARLTANLAPKQSPRPASGKLASIGMGARSQATWSRAREGEPGYVEPHYPTDASGQPLYAKTVAPPLPDPARTNTFPGMA
jgi:hypothetical protein